MKKTIFLLISLLILSGCSQSGLDNQNTKSTETSIDVVSDEALVNENSPDIGDFTIEKIELLNQPECREDYYEGLVCMTDRYEFGIHIKNIGTGVLSFPFYIENTETDEGFDNNEYEQMNKVYSEEKIYIDKTFVYKYNIILEKPPKKIRFRLNQSKIVEGETLNQQIETNYDNNEGEFDLLDNMTIN